MSQTCHMAVADPAAMIAGYSEAVHRKSAGAHHVASPLGAWLLVALAGPLADGDANRALAEVLGATTADAAAFASELLDAPEGAVGLAVGLWNTPRPATPAFARWRAGLPASVESGDVPTQAALDAWAERRTLGIVKQFPIEIGPLTELILASALATRVRWITPFKPAPGTQLGATSQWSALSTVMSSTARRGHRYGIRDTDRAGRVATHSAGSNEGLLVTSVIAERDVDPADVLAAAHSVARAEVPRSDGPPDGVSRVTLDQLALGEGELWTVTEDDLRAPDTDRYEAVLPAWSADSLHKLAEDATGIPLAAATLAKALGFTDWDFQAAQRAKARYTPFGFEAAAVTAVAVAGLALQSVNRVRTCRIRFCHPYAVVATAIQPGSAWHGLPVFSAWVADPEEADFDKG
jgi:hypothetical protein